MSDEGNGFKSGLGGLAQKLRSRMRSARHLDFSTAGEWAAGLFQNQSSNIGFYGKLVTIVLCSYFIADLTAMLAGKLLPEVQSARMRGAYGMHRAREIEDYNVVMTRNLFNSNGVIPGEEVGNPNALDLGGTPVRTTLPFDLIGTMIFQDENRSIATIEDKSGGQVYPVRVEDEIPGKAKILKIEPKRVIFVNETNHHREFVELPETPEAARPTIASHSGGAGGAGIEKVASNQFVVSHTEVEHALSDLNNILTQARAVPNFENGQPAGYKLFQIVPGSIYQKLGLQDGDVIVGFDGQPANDPAAAFEKLSNLRNTSHLDLSIKRSGQAQTFSYDFR